MPIGGKKDNKSWIYLDERECFELWNRLSSLGKTREALIEKGVKNPKTEKPPTKMSISVAAKRFIIKNPEQARIEITEARGGEWAEDRLAFYRWLDQEAFKILARPRYNEWKDRNWKVFAEVYPEQ
jgi:hypothetical protein